MNLTNLSKLSETINQTADYSLSEFFSLSHWQSGVGFSFLIIGILALIFSWIKYGETRTIVLGFILGGIGMFILSIMLQTTPNTGEPTWTEEVQKWYSLVVELFFGLLIFIIPIYILVSLIRIINFRESKVVGRTYLYTIFGFVSLRMLGIIVAVALLPLINYFAAMTDIAHDHGLLDVFNSIPFDGDHEIPDVGSMPDFLTGWIPTSFSIFASIEAIASVVVIAVIFGAIIKTLRKRGNISGEKALVFFDHFSVLIKMYFKWILKLVPFVVFALLSTILIDENLSIVVDMSWIFVLYFIGFIVIMLINFLVSMIAMKGENKRKRYFKAIPKLWFTTFAHHSNVASIPYTAKTARELGSCEEVSTLISTTGSFAGLIMCSAFFPTLIILFSLATTGNIDPTTITMTCLFVFIISIGSTGAGASDIVVIMATLGAIGFDPHTAELVLSVVAVLLIFLEGFNVAGNATTHISVMLMVERYHDKINHGKGQKKKVINKKELEKKAELKDNKSSLNW